MRIIAHRTIVKYGKQYPDVSNRLFLFDLLGRTKNMTK